MTGMELLDGLSFVEDKWIQEAETATLGRNTPWMKVLSVAACLCILVLGIVAYGSGYITRPMESITDKSAAAEAPAEEPAAPAEPAAEENADGAPLLDEVPRGDAFGAGAEEAKTTGELHQIPFARLRILYGTEEGFEAIVEEAEADTNLFEAGMQLTLVIDPSKVPENHREVQNDLTRMVAGAQVEIENGAFDTGLSILYAVEVRFPEGE